VAVGFPSVVAPVVASPISWLSPENLLESAGPIAIWVAAAIIFAECGLLFGFFLPGDSLLFVVGLFVGNGEDSRIFKRKYIDHTEEFFNRYGAVAIVLGRFIAIVRTFITVLAGAAKMDFKRYAFYSMVGALLWAVGLTLLGYLIGNVPFIKNNLEIAIILIVIVSIVPVGVHRLKARSANKHAA
jgi:membrane-associated protein